MTTIALSDDQENIACQGCGKPKSNCTCGCRTCGGAMPNLTINIGSNNKKGYNTLNPASIERDTLVYPMQAQVVSADGSMVIPTEETSTKTSTKTPTIKKKRVFLPEFL